MNIGQLQKDLAEAIASDMENFLDNEFILKKDPSGKKWPITKKGWPFDPHGTVHDSINIKVDGNEINIDSTKPYTIFHQDGTKYLPQRQIFPDENLPKKWEETIERTIDRILLPELDKIGEVQNDPRNNK